MAATVKKNIWLWSTDDGAAPEIRSNQLMAESQGILIPNSPMYLSTSGTWKKADTSDGTGDVVHGLLVGAQNPGTAWPLAAELAANTEIRVMIVNPDDYFAVYCQNNGTDAAAAQANIGNRYGLTVETGTGKVGYTTLDTNNSNATVEVMQVMGNIDPTKHDLTTAPGVAIVKFIYNTGDDDSGVHASKA